MMILAALEDATVPGGGPIAPAWAVVPLAAVTLLVLAVHVATLPRIEMPDSRRRLRTVNGWLMMIATPLAAYGFSIADPRYSPRGFVMAWIMVAGLLVIIILLAAADVLNTWRLHRHEVGSMRQGLSEARDGLLPAEGTSSRGDPPRN